jgi:hypothetical protein
MVAFVFFVLAVGCGDVTPKRAEDEPAMLDHAGLEVVQLESTVLHESETLGIPFDIAVVGPNLVVIDLATDSVLHVIDRTTGRMMRSFARRGAGPGEFEGVWSLDPVPHSLHEVWVYDAGLHRLTYVSLRDDWFEAKRLGEKSINLRSDATLTGPVWVNPTTILSLGLLVAGRIAVLDDHGVQQRTIGELPPGGSNIPPSIRQHAYQATLVPHPERQLLAATSRHASRVEIYRADGSLVSAFDGPLLFEPRFTVEQAARGPVMATGSDLRFGYVDATATNKYLLALFSGRTRRGFRNRASFGGFVHVFDWSGTFQRALQLDTSVITIAVDEQASVLYAVRHDPEPAIVRFPLGSAVQ